MRSLTKLADEVTERGHRTRSRDSQTHRSLAHTDSSLSQRSFDKTLFIVLEPTASLRAAKPHLFTASAPSEKRQLSVAPVRAASRSVSRSVSAVPRGEREDSIAGSELEDEEEEEGGSRIGGRGNVPLFRGTPSVWSPTPEPEARRRAPSVAFGRGDEEEDEAPAVEGGEKDKDEGGAVGLAEKLLRRDVPRGEGEDDD